MVEKRKKKKKTFEGRTLAIQKSGEGDNFVSPLTR
jgi:hypothetical protein